MLPAIREEILASGASFQKLRDSQPSYVHHTRPKLHPTIHYNLELGNSRVTSAQISCKICLCTLSNYHILNIFIAQYKQANQHPIGSSEVSVLMRQFPQNHSEIFFKRNPWSLTKNEDVRTLEALKLIYFVYILCHTQAH